MNRSAPQAGRESEEMCGKLAEVRQFQQGMMQELLLS